MKPTRVLFEGRYPPKRNRHSRALPRSASCYGTPASRMASAWKVFSLPLTTTRLSWVRLRLLLPHLRALSLELGGRCDLSLYLRHPPQVCHLAGAQYPVQAGMKEQTEEGGKGPTVSFSSPAHHPLPSQELTRLPSINAKFRFPPRGIYTQGVLEF